MTERDEQFYIEQCLKGHTQSFEYIVAKYEKTVFNVAFRIIKDYDDARDVTQSVFVKAYEKLGSYNADYKFFSWIYRIAVNESLNFVNKRKPDETIDERYVSPSKTPEDQAQEAELSERLAHALGQLKPDYRAVIVLKHLQGLSYREIAEIQQIPEKTVKSRLFSARQLLKDYLVQQGIAGDG